MMAKAKHLRQARLALLVGTVVQQLDEVNVRAQTSEMATTQLGGAQPEVSKQVKENEEENMKKTHRRQRHSKQMHRTHLRV